jgi:putative Mn2+ efflux pump MntP
MNIGSCREIPTATRHGAEYHPPATVSVPFIRKKQAIIIRSNTLDLFNILVIALGLSMDAFAVSIAAGLRLEKVTPRHTFRIAFHFGLFQFLMPVIGWFAGYHLEGIIGKYDKWAAFGLLCFVGGKMLWESMHLDEERSRADPTRGAMLVTLSVATSIDALAVGLSMAFLKVPVWLPSMVIGVVTACLSTVGIYFGSRIGGRFSHWAEVGGGIVLILMGLKILLWQ